jgi:hypothetical protein
MIRHLVLFKLKDFSSAEDKRKAVETVKAELVKLKDKITVIREFEVGINVGENPSAFDVSILSSFNSWEDLLIYQDHPVHQAFIVFNKNYSVQKAIIDYKV